MSKLSGTTGHEKNKEWSNMELYRIRFWEELRRDIVTEVSSQALLADEIRMRILRKRKRGFPHLEPWLPEGLFWEDILSRLSDSRFGSTIVRRGFKYSSFS